MTETCAGSIYHLDCPRDDIENYGTVASLGKCINAMQMRTITRTAEANPRMAVPGELGELEVQVADIFTPSLIFVVVLPKRTSSAGSTVIGKVFRQCTMVYQRQKR